MVSSAARGASVEPPAPAREVGGIAIFRSLETILKPVGKTVISADLGMEMSRRYVEAQADRDRR